MTFSLPVTRWRLSRLGNGYWDERRIDTRRDGRACRRASPRRIFAQRFRRVPVAFVRWLAARLPSGSNQTPALRQSLLCIESAHRAEDRLLRIVLSCRGTAAVVSLVAFLATAGARSLFAWGR